MKSQDGLDTVGASKVTSSTNKADLAGLPDSACNVCPFKKLIHEWLEYARTDGLSAKTLLDYREKIYKFWWWWDEHTDYARTLGSHPKNVTTNQAREYAAYLREPKSSRWGISVPKEKERLAAASIAAYGRGVKVFFNWLALTGHIPATPFNKLVRFTSRQKKTRVVRNISTEELAKIFSVLSKKEEITTYTGCRNLAMFALLADSGIRRGELMTIRLGDLTLDQNRCYVDGKTGGRYALFSEFCNRPLANYLRLFRHRQNSDPKSLLWLKEDGTPFGYSGFGTVVRRVEARSGVNFHPHTLRHTFATIMAGRGVNVFDLKELLGHASITTTQIYVQTNFERLVSAHRPNSPLTVLGAKSEGLK